MRWPARLHRSCVRNLPTVRTVGATGKSAPTDCMEVTRRRIRARRRSTAGWLEGLLTTVEAPGTVGAAHHPIVAAEAPAVFRSRPAPAARTLLDILDRTVHQHPNAPAIDDGARTLTYRAMRTEVDQVRTRLVAAGI